MLIRKCDRCGRVIHFNEVRYILSAVNPTNKLGEDIKPILDNDLCEDCYAELSNFIFKYEGNNK